MTIGHDLHGPELIDRPGYFPNPNNTILYHLWFLPATPICNRRDRGRFRHPYDAAGQSLKPWWVRYWAGFPQDNLSIVGAPTMTSGRNRHFA